MHITFQSKLDIIGTMPPYTTQQIKDEPMLFNCDLEHAWKYGHELTHALLQRIPNDWHKVPLVVDTKSVMLMPGWYPCIPGWHHDDVERKGLYNQPDYVNKDKSAEFIAVLLNAEIAPTRFLLGQIRLAIPKPHETVYEVWDKQIRFGVAEDYLFSASATDRHLYNFSDVTFHTGVAAVKSGWRWFARVSRYYDAQGGPIARGNQRTNEIRKQVQVYMSNPNAGW